LFLAYRPDGGGEGEETFIDVFRLFFEYANSISLADTLTAGQIDHIYARFDELMNFCHVG
jgi:hypothetical protein